jgi:hypothetical protein
MRLWMCIIYDNVYDDASPHLSNDIDGNGNGNHKT